jgi:hypothetical protein
MRTLQREGKSPCPASRLIRPVRGSALHTSDLVPKQWRPNRTQHDRRFHRGAAIPSRDCREYQQRIIKHSTRSRSPMFEPRMESRTSGVSPLTAPPRNRSQTSPSVRSGVTPGLATASIWHSLGATSLLMLSCSQICTETADFLWTPSQLLKTGGWPIQARFWLEWASSRSSPKAQLL